MYFVIFATDKPGTESLRQETRPTHREYLGDQSAHPDVTIHHGGPTLAEEGGKMNGSMLIVEADTLEAVRAFAKNDPYGQAGLFGDVQIRPFEWGIGRPD